MICCCTVANFCSLNNCKCWNCWFFFRQSCFKGIIENPVFAICTFFWKFFKYNFKTLQISLIYISGAQPEIFQGTPINILSKTPDTLKTTFWMVNLTYGWTKSRPFFLKSGHSFLDFQKGAGEVSCFLIIAIFEGKIIMIKIFLSWVSLPVDMK